ncbi:response regulator [Asticcacaulis sp. DXS10W]|uniref:Response regulator n=1 Tax=Asticcacaulis currens TaxID=2984210 RepID=A0ABT5IFL9_9CAUL|nr:response regulator [Asticcacaulis currens]MDC7694979.1 response regulator [Asticcacaulis currens]
MTKPAPTLLFVDDDPDVRKTAELLFRRAGYTYLEAASPVSALSLVATTPVDLVLLDLNFSKSQTSGQEGLDCLGDMLRHAPSLSVIVVTGHSGLQIAVQALRAGARDFVMKPWNNDRLLATVEATLAARRTDTLVAARPPVLIGLSEPMRRIMAAMDRCAALTIPVLFTGETGTGKSLAATVLHHQSRRSTLSVVECATLSPDDLDDTPNRTLILENIDRLPDKSIPALLGYLHRAPRSNCRVLSTSTRPRAEIGLDRGLLYALSTMDIALVPLRERVEDIVPLAEHFILTTCQLHGFSPRTLSAEARASLQAEAWADNVHALKQVIERALILSDNPTLTTADLHLHDRPGLSADLPKGNLAQSEKRLIEDALNRHNFNVSAAAADLGLTRPSLYRRMAKHGL